MKYGWEKSIAASRSAVIVIAAIAASMDPSATICSISGTVFSGTYSVSRPSSAAIESHTSIE